VSDGVGFRSERGPVLIALMLTMSLVALDATVIATAVPSIVADVGGFTQFPWLFTGYLLVQAVTVPVYGKLADLFGRKPVLLFGVGVFLVASVAAGLAWSMPMLIVCRAVQGLGAGAIQPTSMTVVGDLYSLRERAKVQGYLASVWAASSVVGPALGGAFAEYVSWRWIFFINIPFCLLAGWMLSTHFDEQVERRHPRIDYRGAALLTGGCAFIVLAVLEGGQTWDWLSGPGVVVPGLGVLMLVGFVVVERHEREPILPLWVWRHRLLIPTSFVALAVGGITLGLSSYVPTFVQGVLGTGPLVAGFALATLSMGWPLSGSQSGHVYLRIGFRRCALIGTVVVIAGAALLAAIDRSTHVATVAGICFVIGLGMGFVAAPTTIAAQETVGWSQRGVVTGNNMFCRSLGSAVGVAVYGAIANARLGPQGAADHPDPDVLAVAIQHVFLGVVGLALLMFVAVWAMPRSGAPVSDR
jgi:EmrB/QacA subfamily drug resistance transporter